MGDAQRAIHGGIRPAMHARVRAAVAQRGMAGAGIVIPDELLRLAVAKAAKAPSAKPGNSICSSRPWPASPKASTSRPGRQDHSRVQPKVPQAAAGLLGRGLLRVGTTAWMLRLFWEGRIDGLGRLPDPCWL